MQNLNQEGCLTKMTPRTVARVCLGVTWLTGALFCGSASGGLAAPAEPAGKTRTYYAAADEVDWDYAPSGRDEAMGQPFDAIAKGYTEPGPHRLGRVYKKAIYREYTDGSFSTLKARGPEEQYLGLLGPILRGEVGDTIRVVFKNHASPLQHASPRRLLSEGLRGRRLQRRHQRCGQGPRHKW